MTPLQFEDLFQAAKPFVASALATFPAEGQVLFTVTLRDGRPFSGWAEGAVDQIHLAHAQAEKAAWRVAFDALVADGSIEIEG